MSRWNARPNARLLLADGLEFEGFALGKQGLGVGEIVFNTAMSGYQEILTDPSYAGQMIAFSYPHIGNTGINAQDHESSRVWAAGLVVYEACETPSHWRSEMSLPAFLAQQGVVGITGVDTRRLVLHIREQGAQSACIYSGAADRAAALAALAAFPGLAGQDLTARVSTDKAYEWHKGSSPQRPAPRYHVAVLDYGVKHSILRMLVDRGCRVTVLPAASTAQQVLALRPDGVLFSNGPGDPTACGGRIAQIQALMQTPLPLFGICLGYQMMALASGCQIEKMKFGHHGANHPVLNLQNGRVAISSQNHGFAVSRQSLPADLAPSFISLFDRSLQGFTSITRPHFGFQGHPEAGPGPGDVAELFDRFIASIEKRKTQCPDALTYAAS